MPGGGGGRMCRNRGAADMLILSFLLNIGLGLWGLWQWWFRREAERRLEDAMDKANMIEWTRG